MPDKPAYIIPLRGLLPGEEEGDQPYIEIRDGAIVPSDGVLFAGASYAHQRRRFAGEHGRHYDLGHPWRIYDDGSGPLWMMHQQLGNGSCPCGIVRADSFEGAYEIFCDEILEDGEDPEEWMGDRKKMEEVALALSAGGEPGGYAEALERLEHEADCWEEANGFRANSAPTEQDENHRTGIYAKCLGTGNPMEKLTIERAKDHGLMLLFKAWDEDPRDGESNLTLIYHR